MHRGIDFIKSQVSNAVMQHRTMLQSVEDHESQAEDPRFRDLCSRHIPRMRELSRSVRQDFKNRLTLAGSWYGGVGVTDCIRQAYLASSYGVGAKKLDAGEGDRPWRRFDWEDWEMEGGLPMAPVPWVDVYRSERKHF